MEKDSPKGLQKYGFFQFIQTGGKISYQPNCVDVLWKSYFSAGNILGMPLK